MASSDMSRSADRFLLQEFMAGLSADTVKTAVLLTEAVYLRKAVKVAAQEERVVRELTTLNSGVASVKTKA
ncbi:hypothetical protein T4D_6752 [Trichinella pseudospiralis]|uniref:Uncharacterized protein n=1 Tax=Trichinella pseudospiralis TaxID=6337 RepID=A0A0V1FBC4_TRIPS|nr:hypothetical protein T4D_6752 [Trichinella pseudospiralis]